MAELQLRNTFEYEVSTSNAYRQSSQAVLSIDVDDHSKMMDS